MGMGNVDFEALFTPWVMRIAWRKVETWYENSGDVYDIAERLQWQMDPWSHLKQLRDELVSGLYHPGPFSLIPYPKKDNIRHYCMPSLRDQVAFMACMVLLGPFIEGRMYNVSFGNRLFRPRVLQSVSGGFKRWFRAPFSLSEGRLFDGFSSSYGLFRRVLQGIVDRTLDGSDHTDPINNGVIFEDPDLLPYADDPPLGVTEQISYARLDISKAFPSVDRSVLGETLLSMMRGGSTDTTWGRPIFPSLQVTDPSRPWSSTIENKRDWVGPHPWHLLLADESLRMRLTNHFLTHLNAVEYSSWQKPPNWIQSGRDLWLKGERDIPIPKGTGIPTGLAISGILLNVLLTRLDAVVCERYGTSREQNAGQDVVYLRFVDDMVVLAVSDEQLDIAVRTIQKTIEELGLHLNTNKVKPGSVKSRLFPEETTLESNEDAEKITRLHADKFSTEIVHELSDLAEEGLDEMFGPESFLRLQDLLKLALHKEEDLEVAVDGRLSFSLNKIARAEWLTSPVVVDGAFIAATAIKEQVKLVAERALHDHPWRFKLWTPLIIIAIRLELGKPRGVTVRETGIGWLQNLVKQYISWQMQGSCRHSREHNTDEDRKVCGALTASFLRTQFWLQFAKIQRTLYAVAADSMSAYNYPAAWTRFLNSVSSQEILNVVGDQEGWLNAVYGGPLPNDVEPALHTWEIQALNDFVLATSRPLLGDLKDLGNPTPLRLFVPLRGLIDKAGRESLTSLRNLLRAQPAVQGQDLEDLSVAWYRKFGNRHGPNPIFSKPAVTGISPIGKTAWDWANIARSGPWEHWPELARWVREDLNRHRDAVPAPKEPVDVWERLLRLDIYQNIRRLFLSQGDSPDWKLLAHIFPWAPFTTTKQRIRRSLHRAMYRFAADRRTFGIESLVPEWGLPLPFVLATAKELPTPQNGFVISPDSIVTSDSGFNSIVNLRDTLSRGNARVELQPRHPLLEELMPLVPNSRAPHPIYLFPYVFPEVKVTRIWGWQRAALLLWLISGGERELDQIYQQSPWHLPLSNRRGIRSHHYVPSSLWQTIEHGFGWRTSPASDDDVSHEATELTEVSFDSDGNWSLGSSGSQHGYGCTLTVRLAQTKAVPDWGNWIRPDAVDAGRFDVASKTTDQMVRELAVFLSESTPVDTATKEKIVIFPEWSIPLQYVSSIRSWVRKTGIAFLGGVLAHEVPMVSPLSARHIKRRVSAIVNEAILLLPDYSQDPSSLPTHVYEFRIRKTYANGSERGLIKHLSSTSHQWLFLRGTSWFVFDYSNWGAFSVAVCSDLLDTRIWDSLRGKIQHLFVTAWNVDIDLFDQITWTRGYELFANVVMVNHGNQGGSLAWTPKHHPHSEILRLHGSKQSMSVTVEVPIKRLMRAQQTAQQQNVGNHASKWEAYQNGKPWKSKSMEYKSPSPGYVDDKQKK